MGINQWLANFKQHWIDHNVSGVLVLFDENIIYYETPFHMITDKKTLGEVWQGIGDQRNIQLELEVFNQEKTKFSVLWKLKYIDQENADKEYAGTYLIELNVKNKCTYFHHTCEGL